MDNQKLLEQLAEEEGFKSAAYKDSLGYLTIGYGRLIDDRKGGGISQDEAEDLLRNDILIVERQLDRELPWWRGLDDVRQRVLADMCFNLGITGLKQFRQTLLLIQKAMYKPAATELLDSLAAKQAKSRYTRLAYMIRTGEDPKP